MDAMTNRDADGTTDAGDNRAGGAFFNEQQAIAIGTVDRNVLVLAPPGTGKTLILQHKYVEFHDRYGTGSCAALTFTKKAAQLGRPDVRTAE